MSSSIARAARRLRVCVLLVPTLLGAAGCRAHTQPAARAEPSRRAGGEGEVATVQRTHSPVPVVI